MATLPQPGQVCKVTIAFVWSFEHNTMIALQGSAPKGFEWFVLGEKELEFTIPNTENLEQAAYSWIADKIQKVDKTHGETIVDLLRQKEAIKEAFDAHR